MARDTVQATDHKAKVRSRRALLLASVPLAALLVAVPGHGSKAAQSPFDGLSPMSDGELGAQRGGFSWGQVSFNFGFSITTIVQNALQAGQAFQVTTTFTMSQPGQFQDLQTAVTVTDDQAVDTSGANGSDNVTVTTVNSYSFDFDFEFGGSDDDGEWTNVAVYNSGGNGSSATSAPQAPTPPQITPPTPPTPPTVTAPTPPTPPTTVATTEVTPTVTTGVTPPAPVTTPPVTVDVTPTGPVITPPVTVDVTPTVTTDVTPTVTPPAPPPAPPPVTPPVAPTVTTDVTPTVTTPTPTPVSPSIPETTTPPASVADATPPAPIPVAVVTTPLSGGGHEVSVGDPLATQVIQTISGAGITSVVKNRLSNRLIQENLSMDVMVGGAQVLSHQSQNVRTAARIGRAVGLMGLRK